jgi:hypothetical protein
VVCRAPSRRAHAETLRRRHSAAFVSMYCAVAVLSRSRPLFAPAHVIHPAVIFWTLFLVSIARARQHRLCMIRMKVFRDLLMGISLMHDIHGNTPLPASDIGPSDGRRRDEVMWCKAMAVNGYMAAYRVRRLIDNGPSFDVTCWTTATECVPCNHRES